MSDVLVHIKRAVLAGRYAFSEKARAEMEADHLTELDVAESIITAVAIYKKFAQQTRSERSPGSTYTSLKAQIWMVWPFTLKANSCGRSEKTCIIS